MKGCFLLQRRFAHIAHKIAVTLKQKYGVTDFCGYVYTRSSYNFLKKQTGINYTSLLFDEGMHDYKNEKLDLEYIKRLEKEYGIPYLWPFITVDRVVMHNQLVREYPYDKSPYTHEDIMKIFQIKSRAIVNFFEKEKPDFLFMAVVGNIGTSLLYYIAKKKGIKVLLASESRIGNGWTVSDDFKNFGGANAIFEKLMAGETTSEKINQAKEYIKKFREQPTSYIFGSNTGIKSGTGTSQLKWFFSKHFIRSLLWCLTVFKNSYKNKNKDYTETGPWEYLIDRIKRKTRALIGYDSFYDQVNLNEDYAFYPLHTEPELTTMLFAPYWTDQINLIKQVAKSLPLHFKLYVKDHPDMIGYRPRSYYRVLKNIPNVKLINPYLKTFDIIKNAKIITTITGTAGWEAILLKKPVITFGQVFYNKLSMIKNCRDIETLPLLVKEQLEKFNYNEKEIENFTSAIMEDSVYAGISQIWESTGDPTIREEQIGIYADFIAKKLGLKPI